MNKYFRPEIEIEKFLFENIITTSTTPTLKLEDGIGSINGTESGSETEDVGDALFF